VADLAAIFWQSSAKSTVNAPNVIKLAPFRGARKAKPVQCQTLLIKRSNLNSPWDTRARGLGGETLASIEARLKSQAASKGHTLDAFQSNAEHELITARAAGPAGRHRVMLINPGPSRTPASPAPMRCWP